MHMDKGLGIDYGSWSGAGQVEEGEKRNHWKNCNSINNKTLKKQQ